MLNAPPETIAAIENIQFFHECAHSANIHHVAAEGD
jgi:hypothetical protein